MPQQPRHPRYLSVYKMIPNMITLTALAVGMTAVKFAIAGRWEAAVIAIVVAGFMDAFDGAAARLLKAQSALGAELDSFSDFVCFGVAPGLVLFLWVLELVPRWGWMVALVFAMSVALRLARFNIASEEKKPNDPLALYFTGVPSPAGAGLALLPLIASFQNPNIADDLQAMPGLVAAWTVVVAAFMVSNIPTFSSKQIRIPVRMKVPALGAFGLMVAAVINATWPALTILCVLYLLALPFGVRHYKRRQAMLERGIVETADDSDDGE
jgi:CDP-diacylglycerol--serine O-phosphatidyltransferase